MFVNVVTRTRPKVTIFQQRNEETCLRNLSGTRACLRYVVSCSIVNCSEVTINYLKTGIILNNIYMLITSDATSQRTQFVCI